MTRTTTLLLLLGLLALPTSAQAQGEEGDETTDETADEPAEPAPAEEAEPASDDEAVEATGEAAPAPVEATPVAEPAPPVWTAPEPVEEPESAPEIVEEAPAAPEELDDLKGKREKPDYVSTGDRYRRLGTAISLSIGGSRVAVFDEGLLAMRSDGDFHLAQWELGVMVVPRLGVSVSGMASPDRTMQVNGVYDEETGGNSAWIQIEPSVSAWEVTARFVPTPPFFPVRGFLRAGGGMYLVHVRVTDQQLGGNLRQRDFRGVAPFATVGLGAEISTPTRVRRRAIPLAMGLVIEGGVRVGGGGEVIAAPSSQLDLLGGVDVGPWYFRVAFQGSFWPAPKVPRAVQ